MARAPRQRFATNPLLSASTVEQPDPARPMTLYGTTGLRQSSGLVWEDYEPNLRGWKAVRTYARMANDPTCGAVLWAVESVLRGVEWEIEPAKPKNAPKEEPPSKKAQEGADFLHAVLFEDMRTSFPDVLAEALSVLTYGFSLHELVWERRDDGKVGLADVSPRPQDTVARWMFDEGGETTGFVQRHPITGTEIPIPIQKCLHFRMRGHKRSPEGVSLFRAAYKPWVEMAQLTNIELIGIERDLGGVPVARIPQDILVAAQQGDAQAFAQVQEYVRMVRDLRRNEQSGVVLPSDPWPTPDGSGVTAFRKYDLELISAAGTASAAADTAIRRRKGDIATSVLADFLLLGQQATGSWALSSDKTELFLQSLLALLNAIAAEFQRGLVVPLWALNGLPPETRPTLRPGPIAPVDLSKLAQNISTLATAGARMFPDTALENRLREMLGLPPLSDETLDAAADNEAAGMDDGEGEADPAAPDPFAGMLGEIAGAA